MPRRTFAINILVFCINILDNYRHRADSVSMAALLKQQGLNTKGILKGSPIKEELPPLPNLSGKIEVLLTAFHNPILIFQILDSYPVCVISLLIQWKAHPFGLLILGVENSRWCEERSCCWRCWEVLWQQLLYCALYLSRRRTQRGVSSLQLDWPTHPFGKNRFRLSNFQANDNEPVNCNVMLVSKDRDQYAHWNVTESHNRLLKDHRYIHYTYITF